jgi:hypothetical protein
MKQASAPAWTVPRRASGEFDEVAGTRRLLDILDEDRNGKVDAREIIDALHSHPNKEEIISLLRLHPDPEKALGITSADAEDETELLLAEDEPGGPPGGAPTPTDHKGRKGLQKFASLKLELEHAKGTLAAHTANQKKTSGAKKRPQPRRRLSVVDRNSLLMAALDTDNNGHVDAHELITMIREHPEADQLIDMLSKMPDPKFALGVVKAPSKYRRRSLLVQELNDAKKHLHHTRKRVSTLQTNKQDAQALRDQLVEFKRQHDQLKNDRNNLQKRRAGLSTMQDDDSDDESGSDASSLSDSGDDQQLRITRNTNMAGASTDPGDAGATTTTASERMAGAAHTSALELTLRKHTAEVMQQARKIPVLAVHTWGAVTTTGHSGFKIGADADTPPSELSQLLSPSNHVFIGLWHRTKSTLGAWPLCLSASLASGDLLRGVKVGLGSFDHSSGVVWRFVEVSSLDAAKPRVDRNTNDKYGRNQHGNGEEELRETIRTFIECVDHYDFQNNNNNISASSGGDRSVVENQRLFLTSELTLVPDFTQAATWNVTPYEHGNFRDGPGDVSVQIALAEWGVTGKTTGRGRPHVSPSSSSSSSINENWGRRGSGDTGAAQGMVLCAKSATKEVMLVSSSKLAQSDPKTGLFLYDVAWELTPDAEAPMKEGMSAADDVIPLENYLDGRFLDIVY